jgi:hypothetical protein
MAAAPSTSSVRPKEFHFPVKVESLGERRVAAHVEGKPAIEITSPPVFHGSDPATWSPEDCCSDSNSRLSLATKHRPERAPRRLKGHVSSRPPSTSPSRR